ncbi:MULTISPECIES: SRPBCC family protein [Actinomadura]|uniref:SRPBCC family protein n=1 Tax=Actinomadura TaxID=1988 RepID=UPI00040E54E9|nr:MULTISPECIES: SRPBCC family protein [Actinomadura]RSN69143.1 SRPBCC family protein [Actinomadura sp. WAC 06369]
MPQEIEVAATATAAPEVLFRHLAVPEAWGAWGPFPTPARQVRKGDTTTYGVGCVKQIWPAKEQTVAFEPYTRFSYIALSGLPVRRYRSDVHLEEHEDGTGTDLRWRATFEPLVPGTGPLLGFVFRRMLTMFVRRLPEHAANCPPDCPARDAGDL